MRGIRRWRILSRIRMRLFCGVLSKAGDFRGHVILLNSRDSGFYEKTRQQAFGALRAFPGGLQAGGGITTENAASFLDAGASHVIVTSFVFKDGRVSYENLELLKREVGRSILLWI